MDKHEKGGELTGNRNGARSAFVRSVYCRVKNLQLHRKINLHLLRKKNFSGTKQQRVLTFPKIFRSDLEYYSLLFGLMCGILSLSLINYNLIK